MNKFFASIILILGLFIASPVLAQEKISDYQVDISIDQNTAVVVREQINYDFSDLSNLTEQIEKGIQSFIKDIEDFLSKH